MSIAEGINVENVYVSRSEEEILEELSQIVSAKSWRKKTRTYRGEHVPRVEEQKRYNEPQDVGREKGYDQSEEQLVLEQICNMEGFVADLRLYRHYRDENRCKDQIDHNNTPEIDHGHIELV